MGIIGPGVMNKTTLRSFLMERPDIETVKVKGRGHRSLESYVDYVHQNFRVSKRGDRRHRGRGHPR